MRAMPSVEMPKPLERAVEAAREREAELAASEAALVAAEQNVEAGRHRDIEQAALSREHGEADPGAQHEQAAQQALAESGRERDIRAARARLADERVEELLTEQADTWRKKIEASWAKADQGLTRKLAEVEAALAHRGELVTAWGWLRAVERGEDGERVLRKSSGPARLPDLQELHAAIDQGEFAAVSDRVEMAEREQREALEAEREEFERRLASAQAAQEQQG